MRILVGSVLNVVLTSVWGAGCVSRVVESGIVSSFFSASFGVRGVCSFVLSFPVSIRVLSGVYVRCVIYFSFRSVFSCRVGFRGKRVNRRGHVEWGVRPPPYLLVCGLCGGFGVSGASFF